MYENEEGFWTALNGAYYLLRETYSPLGDFTTGALEYMAGTWNVGYESREWLLWQSQYRSPQAESVLTPMFQRQYSIAAHANTILSYIEGITFLPPASYNVIKGEALAIRALSHLELLRIWGPIPTKVDEQKRYLPYVREVSKGGHDYSNYSEYTAMLKNDLDSALILLSKSDPILKYSNTQLNRNTGIPEYRELHWYWRQNRLNYYAVLGLKARFSLWIGDKQEALKCAMEVINAENENGTPKFQLGTDANARAVGNPLTNSAILKSEHLFSTHHNSFNAHQYYPNSFNTNSEKIDRLFTDRNDFRYSIIW